MDWFETWGLTITVFLPVVGALLLGFIKRDNEDALKRTALLVTALAFLASVGVVIGFDYGGTPYNTYQFEVNETWIGAINANYHVGIDGISLPLLVLSTFVMVLAVIYSWNHWEEPKNPKAFLILMLILATGMNGTFVALDLVLFFIFFEIVLLPMYFMIGIWGDKAPRKVPGFAREFETRLYAAIKFFLFTLFGSAFMLLGFLAIYFESGNVGAERTFDIPALTELGAAGAFSGPGNFAFLVFGAMFLGFAVKVPMWPLHTWLPDAHTAAPTVGSVLLAAIMLKLGSYGFIRIALPILPEEAVSWAPFIAILAVIGIIYGSLACLAQTDMKRLIAFSSVGHMGFVMLGIATMTDIGINASIIGMVAHGLITGLLFFLAGSISHRYHTREMARLGGNIKLMPVLGGILAFTAMASLGLPGLAGFWGEFMSLVSAYNPLDGLSLGVFRTAMVLGAVGTVLTAGYMLWMLQRVNLGEPSAEWEGRQFHDVDRFEMTAWVPLIILIVVIGFYPKVVFNATTDAVTSLVDAAFGTDTTAALSSLVKGG
ncbi:MAG TPA: NADH-quinone oxidoreductase subunit M [Acidimicrobiia bacterium]|jgi:NADH-quinone oxidoreductase subunit M|nr:NADH-quinone oxidoreductase subunit M [Acidimicrobiia bacterium]